MKTLSLHAITSVIGVCSLSATSVIFTAEVNELIVDSTSIDQTNSSGLFALGFFVSAASFSDFTSSAVWSDADALLNESSLTAVLNFLDDQTGFSSVDSITRVPDAAPDGFGVFNAELDAGAAGFHAVFIIHDSSTGLNGLGVGNNVGVVITTYTTQELVAETIGFNSTNAWDTFLLGQSGSLTLATVVPEPSTYAALAGFCALGWVMLRRRRA